MLSYLHRTPTSSSKILMLSRSMVKKVGYIEVVNGNFSIFLHGFSIILVVIVFANSISINN